MACSTEAWRSLAFLQLSGGVDASTFYDVPNWNTDKAMEYAKGPLLRQLMPSLAFTALPALTLLTFMLWRCCRGCMVACQLRLPKEVLDPEALLTGRWVTALKVALAVCCLAAVGSAVYVMVTFSLDVLDPVWSASSAVESQAAAVAQGVRLLLGSVGNATLLVRRLDNLTFDTIRAPALLSSLQSLATYLDDPTTDPPALTQALTSAASLPASLPPPLAAWSNSLTALRDPAPAASASSLPGLVAASAGVVGLPVLMNTLVFRTVALQAALTALPNSEPNNQATDPTITSLVTALAIHPAALSSWVSALDALLPLLDTLTAQTLSPTYPSALAALAAVGPPLAVLPSLAACLVALDSALSSLMVVQASAGVINSSAVQLTPAMQAGYAQLAQLQAALAPVAAANPRAMASQVSALAAQLALPPDTLTLQSELTAVQALLATAPSLPPIRTALANIRTAMVNLSSTLPNTSTALTNYRTSPNAATYSALLTAATFPASSSSLAAATAAAAALNLPASQLDSISTLARTAGFLNTTAASALSRLGRQVAAVTAAQAVMQAWALPALIAPVGAGTAAATAVFATLPMPRRSQVIDAPMAAVAILIDTTQVQGAAVQNQVNVVQNDFGSLPDQITNKTHSLVGANVARVRDQPVVNQYLYPGVQAFLGLGIALVLLLLLFSFLHCPAGIAILVSLLLLYTLLLFAVTVLLAAPLALAYHACPAAEAVILHQLPARWQPLARGYLMGPSPSTPNTSTLLSQAGLLNTSLVDAQIAQLQSQLTSGITAQYTLAGTLAGLAQQAVLLAADISTAFNAVLMRASSQELHPVYQQVKASVCCRLADSVAQYWIALTVCAWTLLGSTWVAMLLLKRLDRVPPVHACCACACLLRSHLNAVTLLQPLTTGTPGPSEGGGDAPPRWSPGGRKEGFHGPMGPSTTVVVHAMDRDHPNMAAPMQAWGSPR